MAAPRPGNTDRGWNDPPVFDYQSSSALQSVHKRTNLNKRVAYPLSDNKDQENSVTTGAVLDPSEGPPLLMTCPAITPSPVQLLPPVPTTCAPAPVPILVPGMVVAPPSVTTLPPSVSQSSTVGYNSLEEAMKAMNLQSSEELVDAIRGSLQEGLDKVKDSFTERSYDDVKKKIKMFQESWDKLSSPVKCGMCSLGDALRKGNYGAAWSAHQNLMVDYTAEVNAWMVGIKKVVHELKNLLNSSTKISEDTELSNQDNSQVNLLDLGTGTSVDSAPENQNSTECITEDKPADTGIDTTKTGVNSELDT